jgi:hypothetical protein
MMIGMSGVTDRIWRFVGYACDIRMGKGVNGYWFKVFFLYWGLEAMTGRVDVFTESYETFSFMGRIIIQIFIHLLELFTRGLAAKFPSQSLNLLDPHESVKRVHLNQPRRVIKVA